MHNNHTQTVSTLGPAVGKIDCAVVRAGPCVLLAIDARPGRLPAQLQTLHPHISWLCADGQTEFVDLGAHAQDRERLVQEIMGDGLLMAELDDASEILDEASHWVLQAPRAQGQRPRSRE